MTSLDDAIRASVVDALADALAPLVDVLSNVDRKPERVVYSCAEAADVLAVSEQQVRRWIDKGCLARLPHTDRVLVPVASVRAFVANAAGVGASGVSTAPAPVPEGSAA